MPWYAEIARISIISGMLIVAPLWLILNYKSKKQNNKSLTKEELYQIEQLSKTAEQLSDRVHTLEKLLDTESPNWRERN